MRIKGFYRLISFVTQSTLFGSVFEMVYMMMESLASGKMMLHLLGISIYDNFSAVRTRWVFHFSSPFLSINSPPHFSLLCNVYASDR